MKEEFDSNKYILIDEKDNVLVSRDDFHKYARRKIKKGEKVIKYGCPIGTATKDIEISEHVHTHNLATSLNERENYSYNPVLFEEKPSKPAEISAYVRKDGRIGIRNDILIIPTVGCVNSLANRLASLSGAFALSHPYGCSQLGDDHERTQKILCSLIKHPNAGGVLVLGLGCENNNIPSLKEKLGEFDSERILFLNAQDASDEIEEGLKLLEELKEKAKSDVRKKVPFSKLVIGLKCGGSDGFSGITANPLVGRFTDIAVSQKASCVLTEVPEMFGSEQILMNRCVDYATYSKTVEMINSFKDYFVSHSQPVSENPSPGNKQGGITTLEEKSLGCIRKGGNAPVTDVLSYGETVKKSGLNLLDGPGNDIVAVTNLAAAGCHLILFTTGRGTPLGSFVPTVKISTNTSLFEKKNNWIDFDAESMGTDELFSLVIETANGKKTKNEINNYREIAIFKDGVTL